MSENAEVSDTGTVEKQLGDVESQLTQLIEQSRRSVRTTEILSVVLPLLILGYFSYIVSEIKARLDAETLIELGAGMVEQNIPVAIGHVREWAAEGIPGAIEKVLSQGPDAISDTRKDVESKLLALSSETLKDVSGQSAAKFADMIRKNKPEFTEVIDELTSEEGAELFRLKFHIVVEELLTAELEEAHLTEELSRWGRLMKDAHLRLEALAKATKEGKLTDMQKVERRLILLSKSLMLE